MLDTLSPLLAAEEGRRVLLVASLLVLPRGCGEPTGPFATLAVTTTSLPNATPGVAYSEKHVATGGDGTYTWSVPAGSLPKGLILAARGGYRGTPSCRGSSFSGEGPGHAY